MSTCRGEEVLNIGIATKAKGFDSLDPEDDHSGRQHGSLNNFVQHGLYDRLVYFRTDMGPDLRPTYDLSQLEPGMAEEWEQSQNGKVWTVVLRQDVRSWRDHRLTAHCVKWSWARAFARHSIGEWTARLGSVENPEAIEVVNDRIVRFHLSQPNFFLPIILGRPVTTIYDYEEAQKHATAEDPWAYAWLSKNDGSFGPYRVEHREPGQPPTFVANLSYWDGEPSIKRVVFKFGDWEELTDLLLKGEIDMVPNVPAWLARRLEGRSEVKLIQHWQGAAELPLRLNCQKPPFSDRKVRQAVAYAIPYKRIVEEVFLGLARPFRSPLSLPETPNQPLPYETDMVMARRLLKEAGYPNGFETDLYYPASYLPVGAEELVGVLVEALAEIGIRVTSRQMSGQEYRSDEGAPGAFGSSGSIYARKGRWPMVLKRGGYRLPDPRYALPHDFGEGIMGLGNDSGYENPVISQLWRRALAESDPEACLEILREAERIVIEDVPFAWLAKPVPTTAVRREIQGNKAWYVTCRSDPLYHRLVKEEHGG